MQCTSAQGGACWHCVGTVALVKWSTVFFSGGFGRLLGTRKLDLLLTMSRTTAQFLLVVSALRCRGMAVPLCASPAVKDMQLSSLLWLLLVAVYSWVAAAVFAFHSGIAMWAQ